jgi:hypothetical protein
MKPVSLLGLGAFLIGASLFSSCASNPKKKDACCSSGGLAPTFVGSASPTKAAPQGSSKSAGPSSVHGSSVGKVREHVSDSTQNEVVRETKPVIGDDSELGK